LVSLLGDFWALLGPVQRKMLTPSRGLLGIATLAPLRQHTFCATMEKPDRVTCE